MNGAFGALGPSLPDAAAAASTPWQAPASLAASAAPAGPASAEAERIRALEEQVASLQAQLLQTQKLTSLGELVSTTTHEFNNALMTIINYARLGMRQKDEASRDKALSRILSASERAAKFTSSVLGVARNRSPNFEPTDLAAIIDDTLFLLDRELKKYRIQVERQIEPTPPALAVGNQLQQVLLNLVINARQAMPQGGRLIIRLSPTPAAAAPGGAAAERTVDLVVRDTGCGIPPDKLRRIFDPFFSTKSGPDETGKGGAGLGLAFCRSVIEAHHGKIRVESAVGKGTSFTLRLPVAR